MRLPVSREQGVPMIKVTNIINKKSKTDDHDDDDSLLVYEYILRRLACLCLSNLISISSRTFGV